MKRLLNILIAVVMILSMLGVTCFADDTPITDETLESEVEITPTLPEETEEKNPIEDGTVEDTVPPVDNNTTDTENKPTDTVIPDDNSDNPSETPENSFAGTEKDFIGEIISVLTNGEFWVIFGTTVSGALAVIFSVLTKFNDIKAAIGLKATNEETAKAIDCAVGGVQSTFETKYEELSTKYDELKANYNAQTAILTLLALQLVKSPNARTEIMKILNASHITTDNVAELVETIEEEIKAADAVQPKPETPALNAITEEVKAESAPVMVLR
jgi:tetrahydromethanopterin S-methyltransferase subunit B